MPYEQKNKQGKNTARLIVERNVIAGVKRSAVGAPLWTRLDVVTGMSWGLFGSEWRFGWLAGMKGLIRKWVMDFWGEKKYGFFLGKIDCFLVEISIYFGENWRFDGRSD